MSKQNVSTPHKKQKPHSCGFCITASFPRTQVKEALVQVLGIKQHAISLAFKTRADNVHCVFRVLYETNFCQSRSDSAVCVKWLLHFRKKIVI